MEIEEIICRILDTKDLKMAEKRIEFYGSNSSRRGAILGEVKICNHLSWLLRQLSKQPLPKLNKQETMAEEKRLREEYYKIGKRVYLMVFRVIGKDNLIISPIMEVWFAYMKDYLSNVDNNELRELYSIVPNEIKIEISTLYCQRVRQQLIKDHDYPARQRLPKRHQAKKRRAKMMLD